MDTDGRTEKRPYFGLSKTGVAYVSVMAAFYVAARFFFFSEPGDETRTYVLYLASLALILPAGFLVLLLDAQFSIALAMVPAAGAWWVAYIIGPFVVLLNIAVVVTLIYLQARFLGKVKAELTGRHRCSIAWR